LAWMEAERDSALEKRPLRSITDQVADSIANCISYTFAIANRVADSIANSIAYTCAYTVANPIAKRVYNHIHNIHNYKQHHHLVNDDIHQLLDACSDVCANTDGETCKRGGCSW